jgi:hypothetical protein
LISASGYQNHTTSPSAVASTKVTRRTWYQSRRSFSEGGSSAARLATPRVHRIPPRVHDDREPPLCGAGRGGLLKVICPTTQGQFFRSMAGRPDQLDWIFEFEFLAQPVKMTTGMNRPPDARNLLPLPRHGGHDRTRIWRDPAAIDHKRQSVAQKCYVSVELTRSHPLAVYSQRANS